MFDVGERANLQAEVLIMGAYKENKDWIYRVKFDKADWSFIVSEKELKRKSICEHAPFAKCNNGEGCDTCQFNEDE